MQRPGHIEIADTSAGKAGRPRAGALLVDQDDVAPGPAAGPFEQHRQVVRGRQAVDPSADDDVAGAGRHGIRLGLEEWMQTSMDTLSMTQ